MASGRTREDLPIHRKLLGSVDSEDDWYKCHDSCWCIKIPISQQDILLQTKRHELFPPSNSFFAVFQSNVIMRLFSTIVAVGLLTSSATSHTIKHARTVPVHQLFQIPDLFIENIAIRPNGHLLLNTLNGGRIYTYDPSDPDVAPRPIAQLEGASAVTGIGEVAPDVFAVVGGVFDTEAWSFEEDSMKVGLLNFGGCSGHSADAEPSVQVVINETDAPQINGLATLPNHPHIFLGAASESGEIWRVNTATGDIELAFYDQELDLGPPGSQFRLGVNGIRIHDHYLYYTNTGHKTFGRVEIDEVGNKVGDVEVITRAPANATIAPDDFILGAQGEAYLTYWPGQIVKVTPDGEEEIIVDSTIQNPTSVALSHDGQTLYVVTATGQLVEVQL